MKIIVCGSMSFAAEMLEIASQLTALGHTVVVPEGSAEYASGVKSIAAKQEGDIGTVIRDHYRHIRGGDAVLVANFDKRGISGYVGAGSLVELAFGFALEKRLYLWRPVPNMDCSDEIIAMKPVILDGDPAGIERSAVVAGPLKHK